MKVISIAYLRNDYKWDFTVPVYHNYFASGCIHHNSTFGAVELAYHLTRNYPDWYPKERRFYKPIKAVVVCLENQLIERVIEPKIKEYMPTGYVTNWKRVSGGYLSKIKCKDGSTVDLLTSEQDDMAFEGADWDFYWGDEPQKKKKYDAIMRGLIDRRGRSVLTFTPLIEPWMKESLVDKADGKEIDVITAIMRDNMYDIKGNQILKERDIVDFENSLSEDVRETRVYGKFFHLRGLVYPEFSDVHKLADFKYNYPDPVIVAMDPHDRQPHHVIWVIVDRTNDLFCHSEISVRCTVSELASIIRSHESKMGYRIRRRYIDPNFGRKPLITTGRNMIEEMWHSGCGGWIESDDAKEEGRLKVKDYLLFNRRKPISHTNKPKLFFNKDRCPLTVRSMENHQYEEWVGKIAGERDPKEKPKDKETHGADCMRYICMSNPAFESLRDQVEYEPEAAFY